VGKEGWRQSLIENSIKAPLMRSFYVAIDLYGLTVKPEMFDPDHMLVISTPLATAALYESRPD
jgi:hypothetical protein